jgi:predicted nucleic acid-binding protein
MLIGYLFWNASHRLNLAYIVHLCISSEYRGNGISLKLIDALKSRVSSDCRGIRVRCRRDYEINKLWEKAKFVPKGDVPGRSNKRATLLTYWWFDLGYPDLFSKMLDNVQSDSKLAVMDANVFFDLQKKVNINNRSVHALKAEWLEESITLCVTDELYTEINRCKDVGSRRKAQLEVEQYVQLKASEELLNQKIENIRGLFPEKLKRSTESDIKQLAISLANDAEIFITRDRALLKLSEVMHTRYGLRILDPSTVIVMQDAEIRESEYYPERYGGTLLTRSKVDLRDTGIEQKILASQGERLGKLRKTLKNCLADIDKCEVIKYYSGKELHALVAYQLENGLLKIPILRVLPRKTTGSLARHLLMKACLDSAKSGYREIRVTDPHLSQQVKRALMDQKFEYSKEWSKYIIPFAGSIMDFPQKLTDVVLSMGFKESDRNTILRKFEKAVIKDSKNINYYERYFWPAKFREVSIPTYLIPIQPQWAMNLFDTQLASQHLFGGDARLVFSLENAYYRAARPNYYKCPARILWYVSKGTGSFVGTQAICACSYLDEIIVDNPKVVFKKLKRLGIYKWKDVLSVAGGDVNKEIMGLRFSKTELFSKRVLLPELKKLWPRLESKPFTPPPSPVKVSQDTFMEMYIIGQEIEKDQDA